MRISLTFIPFISHFLLSLAASKSDYIAAAYSAANVLNSKWYDNSTGLWQSLWWQSGNSLAAIGDLVLVSPTDHDTQASQFIYTTTSASAGNRGGGTAFKNTYYDDEGWWAMGWLRAYDVTKNSDYLGIAVEIFEDMVGGYNATCEGHWWNKPDSGAKQGNNAIGNELFLQVAASLANRDTAKKDYYVNWARTEWEWFKNSGMINGDNIINEGLDLDTCKNNGAEGFTYVQGVILSGLVELNIAAPDQSLIDTANTLAKAGITRLVTSDGILRDVGGDPNNEGSLFKGAFVRNLKQLHQASPNQDYVAFLQKNADTMLKSAMTNDGTFSPIWQGPFRQDLVNAASQTAALDLLIAAAAVSSEGSPDTPPPCTEARRSYPPSPKA